MKFNIADIVEHPSYGVGIVVERCMSASGVNRLVAILKQQLEGLLSCEDVQIVEM